MPTYDGIGSSVTHEIEVVGDVFISNVEGGSLSTQVPFEIFSNVSGMLSPPTDSRQLRLRVQSNVETNVANSYVTDMGIQNTTDNYFFITAPQNTSNVGDQNTFVISKTSNVGIGTTNPTTKVHIQGGSTASITNSNTFPNFIFSRNANASLKHVGGGHNAARHVVFPDDTGKVWAMGAGYEGALGLGDTNDRNVYTLVSALDGVANIVASSTSGFNGNSDYETSILLDDTGNVWTYGDNVFGNLGHGDTNDRYIPTLVTTNIYSGVSITEVSTGGAGALALDSTGQIWGCGYNLYYRIGNLSGVNGTSSITTFAPNMPAGTHAFTSIDIGEEFSLALEDNGRIWSTGGNGGGRAGQGALTQVNGWTQVDNSGGVNDVSITQICSGETHSLARDSTGNVWVTGQNDRGQCGLGTTSNVLYFTKVTSNIYVPDGVTITKIAAGYLRSYALDTAGRIWGAGRNDKGCFGNPPYLDTVTTFIRADAGPIADKSITDFALNGNQSVIARTSDNEYYVVGQGTQLGTGDTVDRFTYTKILDFNTNPPPDYGYTRSLLLENTETGKGPSIELKNKNAVSSRIQMEDGASGKLNIGFVDASFDPKLSGGDGAVLEPFQDRAQSNAMTRGVTINQEGGTMVAGGSTSNIGFNTPIFTSGVPGTNMDGYGDPGQLGYASGTHVLITTEGKVYVAGDNIYGAAGDGTTSNVLVWKESTPPTTYGKIKIFGGGSGLYSIAITEQLYVYRTGRNDQGQLGLDDTTDRSTWTTDDARLVAISCGRGHTLGIGRTSGSIVAAGNGTDNKLGLVTPVAIEDDFVVSDSGAMSGQTAKWVCAGRRQSYAIRSDDALVFVGNGAQGVAGDGTTSGYSSWTVIASSNFDSKTPRAVYLTGQENTREGAMMITTDGKIYGTGNNDKGQLGVGDLVDKTTWTAATGDIASETVTRLALTDRATFALDSTGNVWSTGYSQNTGQGSVSGTDLTTFTKITEPAEFYSKTIVNIMGQYRGVFAVDSEGTMWGTGILFGLGTSGENANQFFRFIKVPIYDVVPKEFKYTPTLTLENPNPDYGATVEFKNPNNRAFINLDDQTSTLRLGFVDNENNAGQFNGINLGTDRLAIGYGAGQSAQGTSSVAIGKEAGHTSQGTQSVALGYTAGYTSQGNDCVAIGRAAACSSQGDQSVAIGLLAGMTSQLSESVAIGFGAGRDEQGGKTIAIGRAAAQNTQGNQGIAIGYVAGYTSQGTQSVAIGTRAGCDSQGFHSVAIGLDAARSSQGTQSVAIGREAAYTGQNFHSVAIGYLAGSLTQGNRSVAVGKEAGRYNQYNQCVAVGWLAASTTQRHNSVAIGSYAGRNSQHERTVVINATGVNLDSNAVDRAFMRPVRNAAGTHYMKYNSGSYEISYYASSDRRMKRNIHPVTTSAVDEISKLKVYTFEEKDNGIHPENDETEWTPSVGVISQEVYKNAPSMRHAIYIPKDVGDIDSFVPPEDPNDPTVDWSVWGTETAVLDYMELVPHTIKAIQELNQEIINLKTRIAELENASASG